MYAPDADGKTKNDHFREMLRLAFEEKRIEAQTILFDNWYASSENIKYIHRLEKFFITSLKENRPIILSKEQGYICLLYTSFAVRRWSGAGIGRWRRLGQAEEPIKMCIRDRIKNYG